jgi:hypothetical protein
MNKFLNDLCLMMVLGLFASPHLLTFIEKLDMGNVLSFIAGAFLF